MNAYRKLLSSTTFNTRLETFPCVDNKNRFKGLEIVIETNQFGPAPGANYGFPADEFPLDFYWKATIYTTRDGVRWGNSSTIYKEFLLDLTNEVQRRIELAKQTAIKKSLATKAQPTQ
jgi:hypothetical protein